MVYASDCVYKCLKQTVSQLQIKYHQVKLPVKKTAFSETNMNDGLSEYNTVLQQYNKMGSCYGIQAHP